MNPKSGQPQFEAISKEGYQLIESKHIPEAIQFFTRAIRENPNNSFHYLGRASARWFQGYRKQAIQDYNRAAENWTHLHDWQDRFKKAELCKELYRHNRVASILNEIVGYKQAK
ncbi:MAG: hypothetical protein KC649_06435 [Candidatus Omnitrophica bacterium]|nr:hypothetical protein [Candidatus Omnitrophota bacterium]